MSKTKSEWDNPRYRQVSKEEITSWLKGKITVVEIDIKQAELDYQKLLEELHNYDAPKGLHDDVADTGEEFDNVSD